MEHGGGGGGGHAVAAAAPTRIQNEDMTSFSPMTSSLVECKDDIILLVRDHVFLIPKEESDE